MSTIANSVLPGLFSPIAINGVELANRFVMPAMQRGWCIDGSPLPQLADYYRRRAEGGVGLIIGESAAIDHPSATAQPVACKLNPETAAAWARCIDAVQEAGGKMLLQLWHEGGLRKDDDGQTLSPHGLGYPGLRRGRAATLQELDELRQAYVRSALIAQSIGATGVELHCAHGYFLDQFLWPSTNSRNDGYGGSTIDDRARFPAEIIAAIRGACGTDFLISVRFSQWKEHDYDAKVAPDPLDLATMTKKFRHAGANLLHASTRRFWTPEWPGSEQTLAGWTRRLSGLPTIAVGSVGLDRDVMESFTGSGEAEARVAESVARLEAGFEAGEFDMISIGRSLIADPDWVSKVRSGDLDRITPFQRAHIDSLEWEGLPT